MIFHLSSFISDLPILRGRHTIRVSEEAGESGAAGYAGEFADDGNGFIGGLQQAGDVFQTVAVDEVADALSVRTLVDGLSKIFGVGAQHLRQGVAVQRLVGVSLLLVHQRTDTAIELLIGSQLSLGHCLQLCHLVLLLLPIQLDLLVELAVLRR